MSMFEREISRRTAGFAIGVILMVCVAFVVVVGKMASRTPSDVTVSKPKPHITDAAVKITEVSNKGKAADKAKPADKTVKTAAKEAPETVAKVESPYAVINERNLFRPPTPGAAAISESPKPAPGAGGPPKMPGVPPMPVPSVGPLPPMGNMSVRPMGNPDELKKGIAFTGAVETPGGTQALLENISSKEVRFVGRGESAFGCRVCDISAQMVSLEKDGTRFNLAIGENKPDADGGGGKPGGDQKPPQPEPGKGEPGKGGPPR